MVRKTEDEEITAVNPQSATESYKFTRDIIWFSIAQLFTSVILGIITLPALTKTYTSDIYGIWVQINITVILISPLLSLQLGLAVVRFLAGQEDRARRRQALGAMLLAIVITGCCVSIPAFFFLGQLSILLFASAAYGTLVIMTIIWTFFNSLLNFFISYVRVLGKIKEISICSVAITIAQMASIVVLARSGSSLESIILCMIVLQVVFSLGFLSWIIADVGFPLPNLIGLKKFLSYSIPQMPAVILLWVISLSDRYFITHFLGLSPNGVYSSSNTLANLTSLFYAPISFVLFPMISKLWAQERLTDVKSYFEHSIRFFLTFAIPGAIGIAVLSQPLLKLLTTSEFLVGQELVLLLAFGVIFLGIYQIGINLILLSKHSKMLPLITIAAAVTSIAMNILLIPRIGIIGAAISNCTAYFILAVIVLVWARKIISFDFKFKYLGKVTISSLAVLLCLYFLRVNNILGIILAIIVGSMIFVSGLFLLKALTKQEQQFLSKTINSVIPYYFKRKL
jgi:O-antigen/teichoic acid export membrane protein